MSSEALSRSTPFGPLNCLTFSHVVCVLYFLFFLFLVAEMLGGAVRHVKIVPCIIDGPPKGQCKPIWMWHISSQGPRRSLSESANKKAAKKYANHSTQISDIPDNLNLAWIATQMNFTAKRPKSSNECECKLFIIEIFHLSPLLYEICSKYFTTCRLWQVF